MLDVKVFLSGLQFTVALSTLKPVLQYISSYIFLIKNVQCFRKLK